MLNGSCLVWYLVGVDVDVYAGVRELTGMRVGLLALTQRASRGHA